MKKIKKGLTIGFAVLTIGFTVGLTGCTFGKEDSTHEHTGKWIVNEYTHCWQYTCDCHSPDVAQYHEDTDGDNICDICQYSLRAEESLPPEETPHIHEYKQVPTEYTICGVATCETPAKYYTVCDCGLVNTNETFFYGETLDHTLMEYYDYDQDGHFTRCENCDYVEEKTSHTFENGCCTVCKYTEGESLGLDLSLIPGKGYLVNGLGQFTGDTLVIPRYHKGLPVVGMLPYSLAWTNVKTVKIHGGIKEICEDAFYGSGSIETLVLEEGIERIGVRAFWGCNNVKELNLPSTIKRIEEGAFVNGITLRSLVIPEGCRFIGESAFSGCSHLMHVTLPSTLQTIGKWSFNGCPKLLEVKNLSSLALKAGEVDVFGDIGRNAKRIYKDGTSKYYTDEKGFVFYCDEEKILLDCLPQYADLVLPDDCQGEPYYVGDCAFASQKWIKTLMFGENITSVEQDAFSHCTALEEVTFSPSVRTLESGAFFYTTSLSEIHFAEGLERMNELVFSHCSGVKALHFPASLKYIFASFSGFNNLEEITIAENEKLYAEGNCLIYKDGTTSEKTLVLGCKNSVIPEGKVETIDRRAFDFSSLTTLKIPESVMEIENSAFTQSPVAVLENGVWYVDNWCIGFDGTQTNVVVKEGTVGVANAGGWEFQQSTCIGIRNAETILLPNSLQHIGSYFFHDWAGEIIWKNSPTITRIGRADFAGYMGTALTIPNTVKVIERAAFANCHGLQELVIPEGVEEVQEDAIRYCTNLKKVYLPSSLQSFGMNFYGVLLEEITIGADNTNYKVVNGCLVEIASKKAMALTKNGVLPSDGSVEILPHPLLSCREETELIIPEGIKEIKTSAIFNCDNLTVIYLPKSIKILEYHWWDTCDKLTDIYYAGTEEEWNALYVPDVADQGITMHFLGETEAV